MDMELITGVGLERMWLFTLVALTACVGLLQLACVLGSYVARRQRAA